MEKQIIIINKIKFKIIEWKTNPSNKKIKFKIIEWKTNPSNK